MIKKLLFTSGLDLYLSEGFKSDHLLSAFLVHGGLQITFLLWRPDPDTVVLFYVFAALWGMGDAVIQTQINGTSPVT